MLPASSFATPHDPAASGKPADSAPEEAPGLHALGGGVERLKSLSIWLLLAWMLLAASWTTIDRHLPWPAFRQEVFAGLAFALIAVAAVIGRVRIVWPPLARVAFGLAVIPWIQHLAGLVAFAGDAWLCSIYLSAFGLSVVLGASLQQSDLRDQCIWGLICVLLAVGIISTAMALSQWLGPSWLDDWMQPIPPGGRPHANLGQPNHLATQLILALLAVWWLFESRRLPPGWTYALGCWLLLGVALSQSRTGWLALALVAAGWCWFGLVRKVTRLGLGAVAFGAAIFVAMVVLAPLLQTAWQGAASEAESQQLRTHVGTRPGHWTTLWAALMLRPWSGYGWNQVTNAQFETAIHFPMIREWTTHSHNLVLDLLIYNGLPIGGFICIVLGACFVARATWCRAAPDFCVLLMLVALFTHAMLEYPLHYSFYLLPVGLMMGMLYPSDAMARYQLRRGGRMFLALSALALTLLAGAVGAAYLRVEEALGNLELSERRIGPAPGKLPAPDWPFLDGWAAYHRAVAMSIGSGMADADLKLLDTVARRYPYPNVLERYAKAAALNGREAMAARILKYSCKVHSIGVCAGMKRRWAMTQAAEPALRHVAFPTDGE